LERPIRADLLSSEYRQLADAHADASPLAYIDRMPRIAFLPTIVREALSRRSLPREPEPDLVMESDEQVAAYSHAGRIDGVMSASYLFHSAGISEAIQGASTVVDLACGPATQLAQVASLNPGVSFHGVDLSPTMLDSARKHIAAEGLANVRFTQGDITRLDFLETASVDAVTSTMALHHLPTLGHLERCFAEIARVLKPGGALYLVDFGRLKSLYSVLFFAYMNADAQPHIFSLDYERSLRAAFEYDELKTTAKARLPEHARIYSTFITPMLTLIRTPSKPLSPALRDRVVQMRAALPRRYRADLDDMRMFFRLKGLPSDPFR
jgi:arsenite methyltransferase